MSSIRIETAQFDLQKLKNPNITDKEYQQGEQTGFWNVREYVLWRDNHICQHCSGKSKDAVLEAHHLESRQNGGDRPGNLLTLCKTCHKRHHAEGLELPGPSTGFRASAHISIMRWKLYERAQELGIPVSISYGYQTKSRRIRQGLKKSHANDAFVLAGGNGQIRDIRQIQFRQVRKQNRKLHKGIRSHIRNKVSRVIFGFQQWDKVRYKSQYYFIKGRRSSGYFSLSDVFGSMAALDGKKLASVKHSRLVLIENAATLLGKGGRHSSPG